MQGLPSQGRASSGPVANVLNRTEQATREFLSQIEQATRLVHHASILGPIWSASHEVGHSQQVGTAIGGSR